MKAAMVGLGRMGGPMLACAVAAGLDVTGYDIAEPAREAAAAAGARVAGSPVAAAEGADAVSLIVFDDQQARDVMTCADGILSTLAPGAVVAVHTTVTLQTIAELAGAAAQHGVALLDAGISGGEPGARAGTLVTMVGGDPEAVRAADPLLMAYSREVIHAGPLGAGMTLKLARNATGYAFMVAVQEAMELAATAGIDAATVKHVLEATAVAEQGWAPFTLGGPSPIGPGTPADFRRQLKHTRDLGHKDMDQALALASQHGLSTAFLAAARAAFSRSVRL
jgi:3-hydroxyisobutyrate dehydrogenase